MKQPIMVGISALLMAVCLPVLLLVPVEAEKPENRILVIEDKHKELPVTEEAVRLDCEYLLHLKTENGIQKIPMDEYLTGVVLSEMPASFELEALKAQAVAARTFTMRQVKNSKHEDCDLCGKSSCCQAWTSKAAFQEKLGLALTTYWEKASKAVKDTDGEVLTYEGSLIDAVYFSCSGGTTEDAVAVWGSDVPYLQSVESKGEEQANKYKSEVTLPQTQFQSILSHENPAVDFSGTVENWFGETVYSDGGGVYTMKIGGETFNGTDLRRLFGLNSTKFSVKAEKDNIVFDVRGYGHGVGMSQYGANAMAQAEKSYQDILLHYYTGVELKKLPRP